MYGRLKKLLPEVSSNKVCACLCYYTYTADLLHSQLLLCIFMFDNMRGFQALGTTINLHPWYNGVVTIHLACFVSRSKKLILPNY